MMRPRWDLQRTVLLLVFVIILSSLTGCSRSRKYEDIPMDAAWQKIMERYNKGKYLDAADRLEIFLINHAGSALADSAQFILGECHFEMKEYIIAASEYQKLFVQYPQSSLASVAEYKMAVSYENLSPKYSLDQEYTQRAIDTFQLFIEDYPNSRMVPRATEKIQELREKLAHKEYFNGVLYHKMGEYPAARIYFEQVMNDYYDTGYAARSQFHIALGYQKAKDWELAVEAYAAFISKYDNHQLSNVAVSNLNECRRKLNAMSKSRPANEMLQPAGEMEAGTGISGS